MLTLKDTFNKVLDGNISARSLQNLHFRLMFKIRTRFRVRVKDRVMVIVVFRIRFKIRARFRVRVTVKDRFG